MQILEERTRRHQRDMLMNKTQAYRQKRELQLFTDILHNPLQSKRWSSQLRRYPSSMKRNLSTNASSSGFKQKSVQFENNIANKYSQFSVIRSQSVGNKEKAEALQKQGYLTKLGFHTQHAKDHMHKLYQDNQQLYSTFNPRVSQQYFGLKVIFKQFFSVLKQVTGKSKFDLEHKDIIQHYVDGTFKSN